MVVFRVVQVLEGKKKGWAVQRQEPDGIEIVVSRIYGNPWEAGHEAENLNQKFEKQTLG